jgi:hypothetical protein
MLNEHFYIFSFKQLFAMDKVDNSLTNGKDYNRDEIVDSLNAVSIIIILKLFDFLRISFFQLLTEHSNGIRLTAVEDAYKVCFSLD